MSDELRAAAERILNPQPVPDDTAEMWRRAMQVGDDARAVAAAYLALARPAAGPFDAAGFVRDCVAAGVLLGGQVADWRPATIRIAEVAAPLAARLRPHLRPATEPTE